MSQEAIREATRLKNVARTEREDGALERARDHILTATALLNGAWNDLEKSRTDDDQADAPHFRDLLQALAECYGVQGGIYRSLNQPKLASLALDRGYEFERNPSQPKKSSYNLVQRLVSRTFEEPSACGANDWRVENLDMWAALDAAWDELAGQRRGDDPWAAADAVCLSILRSPKQGDKIVANTLDRFYEFERDVGVLDSTIRAFSELADALRAQKLSPGGLIVLNHLENAIDRFRELRG